jgi:hypothetical protein
MTDATAPARNFLIRAFAPGCPTMLRSIASTAQPCGGEHVAIVFDLADAAARARADELVASAAALQLIAVGQTVIHDLAATLADDLLTVAARLVSEPERIQRPRASA